MADAEAAVAAPVEEQEPEQPAGAPVAEEQPAEAEPKTEAKKKSPKTAEKAVPTPVTDGPSSRVKRERKQVERFVPTTSEKEDHFEIKKGQGSKLRDIPNVAFKLGKVTGKDELAEHLHMLLYRRKGTVTNRKRDILDFSGFSFEEAEEEKEMKYRRESLGKWNLDLIHRLMDALDLARGSGDKSSKVEKVLEFLRKPEQLSDINLADKEAEKREKAKAKKEKEKAKKEQEKAKKEKEKAKKEKEAAKRKASAEKKGRPAKKAKKVASKEEESEPELEEEMEVDDEAGGEDPIATLDSEKLRADIEQELGGMAVEELKAVNVRLLLGKLTEKYGFDVKSRKAEIREMAVNYCNQRLVEEESPEEEEEAGGKGAAEPAAACEEFAAGKPEAGGEAQQQQEEEKAALEEAAPAAAADEAAPAEPAAAEEAAPVAEEDPPAAPAEPMKEAPAEEA